MFIDKIERFHEAACKKIRRGSLALRTIYIQPYFISLKRPIVVHGIRALPHHHPLAQFHLRP